MRRIDGAIGRHVQAAIERGEEGSKLHKLGCAMGLIALLDAKNLGKYKNETLDQFDPDAREVIELRRTAIDAKIAELMRDKVVRGAMARARSDGMREVLGDPRVAIDRYANYIVSDRFWQGMAGLTEQQQANRLEVEYMRLACLDPELAQDLRFEIATMQLQYSPVSVFSRMPANERTQATEKILLLLAGLIERDAGMTDAQWAVGQAKKGSKLAGTSKTLAKVLRNSQTRFRVAQAIGKRLSHRSFYAAMASDNPTLALGADLDAESREAAEQAFEAAKKYGWIGRGLSTLTTLIGIAGIVTSWPPTDGQGNIVWTKLGVLAGSTLSVAGSGPMIAEFIKKDLLGRAAKAAGIAAKVGNIFKVLGPIGDTIFVVVNIAEAFNEAKNEDTVGMYSRIGQAIGGAIGVAGGLILLFGGTAMTGVGLPIALAGAIIGLVAAVVDWIWGESAGAGQAKQDLRYLGISGAEEAAYRTLATDRHTVTKAYAGYRVGGTYTVTEHRWIGAERAGKRAGRASLAEKRGLLNQLLLGHTDGEEEDLIFNVLRDTPYDNDQFLELMEAVDAARVAEELENSRRAGTVMAWTAIAYTRAKRQPGRALNRQLLQHGKDHDVVAIDTFLDKVVTNGDRAATYHAIEASVICETTKLFLKGHTNSAELRVICRMLEMTSDAQFDAVMEWGSLWYIRRMASELTRAQLADLTKRMTRTGAKDIVRKLANHRQVVAALTTETKTGSYYNGFGGGRQTYTYEATISDERIRARAKAANRFEKVTLITQYLHNNPSRGKETLVYQILCDVPYARNQFLQVIESLDGARVAYELGHDQQAANVMMWTLQAYHNAGRVPGKSFYDQLEEHCRRRRTAVIDAFLDNVVESSPDNRTLDRKIYFEIDPKRLYEATRLFENPDHSGTTAQTTLRMLDKASDEQFDRAIELGHLEFVKRLKKHLPADRWIAFHDRMQRPGAKHTVRGLARQTPQPKTFRHNLARRNATIDQLIREAGGRTR